MNSLRGARAQVLVLFALLLPALLAGVGLAIEGGFALAQRQRMQAASDLAAVNAAYCIADPTRALCVSAASYPGAGSSAVTGMARSVAAANGYSSGVTVVYPYTGDTSKVSVAIAEQVPTPLLRMTGFSGFPVGARAVGAVHSGVVDASLFALDPTQCGAISLSGNASINVNLGWVHVNSNCATALSASGNASITASALTVVGGYTTSGSVHFSPAPTTHVAPLSDPLASVPVPSTTGLTARGNYSCSGGTSSDTISPGIYSSLSVSSGCHVTMNPGIYYLNGGLSTSGSASLTGDGVFLYNASGAINLTGGGVLDISPPTSGPYKGMILFQARTNTNTLSLSGDASVQGMQGTIYGAQIPVTVSGSGSLPAQFIVDSVSISGAGTLNVSYTANQVYGVPTMALVE